MGWLFSGCPTNKCRQKLGNKKEAYLRKDRQRFNPFWLDLSLNLSSRFTVRPSSGRTRDP